VATVIGEVRIALCLITDNAMKAQGESEDTGPHIRWR
jgi:hypothetical protein